MKQFQTQEEHLVHLLRWPCGCVVDGSVELIHASWHVAYECAWCSAVFSRAEFVKWMTEGTADGIHLQEVPSLLLIGEQLVEVGDECPGYELPLVREARIRGAKWKHLRVPFSEVAVLRN